MIFLIYPTARWDYLGTFLMANVSTSTASMGESFAALFEESLARQEMRSGEVITAEVVSR